MERHYMKKSFPWTALSERSYGFVVRASAVQYDVTGEPCVFAVTCDGWRSLYDEINAGRAYLYPVRVTVVGEYEPGVMLIRSDELRNGAPVFAPDDVKRLPPDYAARFARGETDDPPAPRVPKQLLNTDTSTDLLGRFSSEVDAVLAEEED